MRRLNESIMSTQTGAQEWNPDHYSGFNAKTEFYDYKYLGEKNLLACAHAAHSPEVRCATDGGTSACPEDWEMRICISFRCCRDASPAKPQGR